MNEEKLPEVDLSKITAPLLKELIAANIITEQGIRTAGTGIMIQKLATNNEFLDKKVSLKLSFIEKKMEKIAKHFNIKLDDY